MSTPGPLAGRLRGMSLVELLVGLALGLLIVLAITRAFAVFEGYKRTTTGGADAQINGAIALSLIEREVRIAAYGMADLGVFGCAVRSYNKNRNPPDLNFLIAPVVITQGTSGAPDAVTVIFSDSEGLPVAVPFQQQSGASANYKVDNRAGFGVGDLVLAVEGGKDCTVAEVTDLPGTPGQTDVVIHNSGMYKNDQGDMVESTWNKPSGLGVTYDKGVLYNLGKAPNSNEYRVESANLVVREWLGATGSTPLPVVANVVDLQAQYGKDTDSDGVVDTFDEVTPATPAGWAQVLAVRVAVVSRSGHYEKTEVSPPAIELWPGGPTFNPDAGARHYRYRVYSTVVPLRNMIWRPV
ncbi:MAG: PilW family protein [Pseudomonadota bacterium]